RLLRLDRRRELRRLRALRAHHEEPTGGAEDDRDRHEDDGDRSRCDFALHVATSGSALKLAPRVNWKTLWSLIAVFVLDTRLPADVCGAAAVSFASCASSCATAAFRDATVELAECAANPMPATAAAATAIESGNSGSRKVERELERRWPPRRSGGMRLTALIV